MHVLRSIDLVLQRSTLLCITVCSETAALVISPQLELLPMYLLIQCVMVVQVLTSQCLLLSVGGMAMLMSRASSQALCTRQQLSNPVSMSATAVSKSVNGDKSSKKRRLHRRSMSPRSRKKRRTATSSSWTTMQPFSQIPFFTTSFRYVSFLMLGLVLSHLDRAFDRS